MREHDEYRELERQAAERERIAFCARTRVPVFISGASREGHRAWSVARHLEATGLVHVVDRWFDDAALWCGRDAERTRDAQDAIAREHAVNIRQARIFWLLYPTQPSLGAFVELGQALMRRDHEEPGWHRVVVTGLGCSNTVYTAPADYRDECDALGLREVLRLAHALQPNAQVTRHLREDPRAWVT